MQCANGSPDIYTYVNPYLDFIHNVLAGISQPIVLPTRNYNKENFKCKKTGDLSEQIKDLLKDI